MLPPTPNRFRRPRRRSPVRLGEGTGPPVCLQLGIFESHVERRHITSWDVPAVDPHYALLRSVAASVPCALWRGNVGDDGYPTPGGLARLIYLLEVGPIPVGWHIDHLCRRRACIEVAHLDPVTPSENARRGINGQKRRSLPPR